MVAVPLNLRKRVSYFLAEPVSVGGDSTTLAGLFDVMQLTAPHEELKDIQDIKNAALRIALTGTDAEKIFGEPRREDFATIRRIPEAIESAMARTQNSSMLDALRLMRDKYQDIIANQGLPPQGQSVPGR